MLVHDSKHTFTRSGATAVIIYNNVDPFISGGTLTAPNPEYVPAGLIQRKEGLSIRERILAGDNLTVFYEQIQLLENKTTWNVIAETKAGDPSNVIQVRWCLFLWKSVTEPISQLGAHRALSSLARASTFLKCSLS